MHDTNDFFFMVFKIFYTLKPVWMNGNKIFFCVWENINFFRKSETMIITYTWDDLCEIRISPCNFEIPEKSEQTYNMHNSTFQNLRELDLSAGINLRYPPFENWNKIPPLFQMTILYSRNLFKLGYSPRFECFKWFCK